MGGPPTLLPWLALIWVALQVLRRRLPTKHDKFITFFTYVMTWAILLEFFRGVPDPLNVYASWVTSISFVVFLIWMYLAKSISKKVKIPRLFESANALLTAACINEGISSYNLYETGYLAGAYDTLSPLAEVIHMPVTDVLPTVYFGIVFCSVGIAFSTIVIAYVLYSRGLRGAEIRSATVSSKLT